MLLQNLCKQNLITPPTWLPCNTQYLCIMGSQAYGVATDNSDMDIYGVTIPLKEYVLKPNMVHGYDLQGSVFEVWQQHHIKSNGKEYDFHVYGLPKYFRLLEDNNPNVLDSLFVRRECVIHTTESWDIVRQNRPIFLHKGIVNKLRGYAFNQLHKAKNCQEYLKDIHKFEDDHGIPRTTTYNDTTLPEFMERDWRVRKKYDELWSAGMTKTSRFESQKILGYDAKFLYHVYRLISQAEQILEECDLDLQEPGRVAKMKAIRKGEVPQGEIVTWFNEAEQRLDRLKEKSSLRNRPPKEKIRGLLMQCLESHYGSIEQSKKELSEIAIQEIRATLERYGL